jgi:hypothetical protein
VEHPVEIANHVAEKLPHFRLSEVTFTKIAHLALQGQVERLLRRFIEADGAKDIPMPALVGTVLDVSREKKVISGPLPKWVTTTNTQPYLPGQVTPIPNLFVAGAHTKTEVDVWSIEGAVESGRRAARAIDPAVEVISQY